MKKKVGILAALLLVLSGIAVTQMVGREPALIAVPAESEQQIQKTVDQLLHAVARRDGATVKKLWRIPENRQEGEAALQILGNSRNGKNGTFDLQNISYDGTDRSRCHVSGFLPAGNFVSLVVEQKNAGYQVVSVHEH